MSKTFNIDGAGVHKGKQMGISIDHLSEPELVHLNEKIVQRLRILRQMRAHVQMLNFTLGERVWFQTAEEEVVRGTLVKYNKKSVTVVTEEGHRWTVAPGFLRKATKATIIEMGHIKDASRG